MICTLFDIVNSAIDGAPEASASVRDSIACPVTHPQPLPSLYRMGPGFLVAAWDEGVQWQSLDVDFRPPRYAELVKAISDRARRPRGRFAAPAPRPNPDRM